MRKTILALAIGLAAGVTVWGQPATGAGCTSFGSSALAAMGADGGFVLQDHGDLVEFHNIRIKDLD